MAKPVREFNDAGQRKCPYCGEFKDEDKFRLNPRTGQRDSYCVPCRKQYQASYHARRALEDPLYLIKKAAKLRHKYRRDPAARARRIESVAKYRSKIEREIAQAAARGEKHPLAEPALKEKPAEEGAVGVAQAEPAERPRPDRAEKQAKKKEAEKKWEDL